LAKAADFDVNRDLERARATIGRMRVMLLKLSFTEGHPVTQALPLFIGKEDEEIQGSARSLARFSDGMVLGMRFTSPCPDSVGGSRLPRGLAGP
jgi:hypothetical protein